MTRLLTQNDSGDSLGSFTLTDSGTVTVDTTTVFAGANALRFDTTAAYRMFTGTTTLTRAYYTAFVYRPGSVPDALQSILLILNTGGSTVCTVREKTNGRLQLYDSSGTPVGNETSTLDINYWTLVEVKVVQQAAGNGTLGMWINGEQVVADTSASVTNTAINRWRLGRPVQTAAITSLHIDRIAINDDQGAAPDNTWVHPSIPVGEAAELRPSGGERRPVIPCGTHNINNIVLKAANDRWGMRFVLDVDRTIYRIIFGANLRGCDTDGAGGAAPTELSSSSGYGDGNGGTLKFELFAVDSSGFPTGTAIATESGINAVDRYVAAKTALGITTLSQFLYAHLNTGTLTAGEYVLVVSNTHASPLANWCSMNCPVTSVTAGGPHNANTRSKYTSGAIMGLDPRECIMWSIEAGTSGTWVFGQAAGGDMIADGLPHDRAGGHISGYYVSTGDDAVRLPYYGFLDSGGNKEGIQPYYGSNVPVTGGTLRCKRASRAVTFTKAGGFAPSGFSVGTLTVTNIHSGVSGSVTLSSNGWQEGTLSTPVPVAAGEQFTIAWTGKVAIANADAFQVATFDLGNTDWPFTTDGQGAARAEVYAL